MSLDSTAFSPPKADIVEVGGEKYTIYECRPCDIEVWGRFIEAFKEEGLLNSIKASVMNRELNLDFKQSIELVKRQPGKACDLLAALLNPDPVGAEAEIWQKEKSSKFYGLPIHELTGALGKWIEVNVYFFGQMAAPLLMSAVKVLIEINKQIEQLTASKNSSFFGSA